MSVRTCPVASAEGFIPGSQRKFKCLSRAELSGVGCQVSGTEYLSATRWSRNPRLAAWRKDPSPTAGRSIEFPVCNFHEDGFPAGARGGINPTRWTSPYLAYDWAGGSEPVAGPMPRSGSPGPRALRDAPGKTGLSVAAARTVTPSTVSQLPHGKADYPALGGCRVQRDLVSGSAAAGTAVVGRVTSLGIVGRPAGQRPGNPARPEAATPAVGTSGAGRGRTPCGPTSGAQMLATKSRVCSIAWQGCPCLALRAPDKRSLWGNIVRVSVNIRALFSPSGLS
jgi:hypothetical protein